MLYGSFPALITPFTQGGEIDIECFIRLIHWHIEQKSDGLVICGCTGEAATLSSEEQYTLIRIALQEARGKIPIIAGTSSNDTKITVQQTKAAKEAGADACLVIIPYYNKPTFRGCLAHFTEVAACNLPIILYYHPGRTGITLSTSELITLCSIPGIVALKDSSADVSKSIEFMKQSTVPLLSGDDSPSLSLIASGAKGSISVIANLYPKIWQECIQLALQGKIQEAQEVYNQISSPIQCMNLEINPQCIKYAMSLKGLCRPFLRLPLLLPETANQKKIAEAIQVVSRC